MFKTEAKKTQEGNYNVASTCGGGHTAFKKAGDSNPYNCPYCGKDMV